MSEDGVFRRLILRDPLRFLAERMEERVRNRARQTGSDCLTVNLHNWDKLARGAGQKRLVCAEQSRVVQDGLSNGNPALGADVEQELSRDAGDRTCVQRGRQRGVLADEEEIRLG